MIDEIKEQIKWEPCQPLDAMSQQPQETWLVTYQEFDSFNIIGTFSSEEKTKEFLSKTDANGMQIKRLVVDDELAKVAGNDVISHEFHVVVVGIKDQHRLEPGQVSSQGTVWQMHPESVFVERNDDFSICILAPASKFTKEQTEGIALEKYAQYQRIKAEQPDLTSTQILNRLK